MKTIRLFTGLVLAGILANGTLRAAESFIIADNQTGYILAEDGLNEKRQIGSLTKIATAMVVLDWLEVSKSDASAIMAVPQQAVAVGGENPLGLMVGDELSLRDLLYCALMASDNIAAQTLAFHVGAKLPNPKGLGPVDNFVAHMNALAKLLEMKRTLYLNPTGLDNLEGTLPHSTVGDIARLIRYSYSKPSLQFYVAQKTRDIHVIRGGQPVEIPIQNTNQLLGQEGIDGVKTGRTGHAGDCIALSADRPPESRREGEQVFITPRRIIVVLLASPDRMGEGLQKTQQGWVMYDQWAAQGRPAKKSNSL